MYKLIDFSFGYSDILFDDINIEINRREITLIMGANGSGKTTLLSILSGLNKNYNGFVKLKNKEIHEMSFNEISNEILYQKQEPIANIVAATPFEDLKIWLTKFASHKYDSNRIDNALKRFGIYELRDNPIWKLSGGQLKRAGLSSLLLYPDKFWLLDEPLSGLDTTLQQKFIKILKKKKSLGIGAVIISHRIELFKDIADNIMKIDNRKIVI